MSLFFSSRPIISPKFSGHSSPRPLNASEQARLALIDHMQTPAFARERKAVIDEARRYIENYLAKNPQMRDRAVVLLDIDDTLLDATHLTKQCILSRSPWDSELFRHNMLPVIPETLDFIRWLQSQNIRFALMTGRESFYRDVTVRNLAQVGLQEQDLMGLFLRDEARFTDNQRGLFKISVKQAIERERNAQGEPLKILAELGDQASDFVGDFGKPFKLPNDLYQVA